MNLIDFSISFVLLALISIKDKPLNARSTITLVFRYKMESRQMSLNGCGFRLMTIVRKGCISCHFSVLDSIHRTIYLSLATTKSCLEGHLHTLMRSVDQVLSVSIFWQVCLIHVVTELGAVVAIPIVLRHVVKVRPLFFVLSVLSSMYHKLLAW